MHLPAVCVTVATVRPSLLSRQLTADLWGEAADVDTLSLQHGDEEFARLSALSFDQLSLNLLLDRARNRRPRRRA